MNGALKVLAKSLFCIAIMFTNSYTTASETTLSGTWEYESSTSQNGLPLSQLTLDLEVRPPAIVGVYCYISNYGRHVDCPGENQANIAGVVGVDGRSATLRIHTRGARGEARVSIALEGDMLTYRLERVPNDPFYSGPSNVVLGRATKLAAPVP